MGCLRLISWYRLCDEYGLYVVDEANIETHGCVESLSLSSLASSPTWAAAFLARARSMVLRARNHASVVAWSLGRVGPSLGFRV